MTNKKLTSMYISTKIKFQYCLEALIPKYFDKHIINNFDSITKLKHFDQKL